jgi:hypothetical protein
LKQFRDDYNNVDFEEALNRAVESGKIKYNEEQERKIVEKALQKDRDNMRYLNRAFPYITEEHLLDTIKGLYPDLNELIIVDLDQRDGSNIPLIRTKNFRTVRIHHKTWKYNSGRIECELDVKIKLLLAVIEKGTVYIKSANLQNSYWNKRS